MARRKRADCKVIATYSDSWFELTYRTFAGVMDALPTRSPPALVDYGPIPLVPETSADAPPWRGKVDGALVYGSTTGDIDAFVAWLRRGEVPTVVMVSDLIDSGLPTVCVDYREIGRIAAQHLVTDCGCKSFLRIGPQGSMATVRREQGFRDALAEGGHVMHSYRSEICDVVENPTRNPFEDAELDALFFTLPRPIGVLAHSDKFAAATVENCKRLGLRVPQDVAVLGTDNTVLAHTHSPSLTSIRVREADVGAAALRLLMDLMNGASPPQEPVLVGGCELYARVSTVGPRERSPVLTVDVAMERIQASACSGLTVERLAESLGVSRRRLEELFQRERGSSPNEEIQRVRFEKAALLLRFTTHSVTQIAQLTGFSFPPPFCRFFQRMIGMTPLEYRRAGGPMVRLRGRSRR